MDINVKGVWLSLKHEIPAMLKTGGGAIVNNSSVGGLIGLATIPIYIASKHAVNGLTKSVALEYAKQNVRVNAVAPGVIETRMFRDFAAAPEVKQALESTIPIGRVGQPERSPVSWSGFVPRAHRLLPDRFLRLMAVTRLSSANTLRMQWRKNFGLSPLVPAASAEAWNAARKDRHPTARPSKERDMRDLTRREFLEESLKIGGAIGVGFRLPSQRLAAGEKRCRRLIFHQSNHQVDSEWRAAGDHGGRSHVAVGSAARTTPFDRHQEGL